ncbi:type IV pilin protein [Azonexus sp.]|uniref:type IV pilin protein n=1 Tax=Azonexus sp. TaxID=1872668 RepID=UPI002829E271|nr:type IV pilin protein [Azonexus sp.]MDR1995502.1 prepilin-type N-terminal cleavage/methylation domain-containing protein [Azonexus sp.]
MRIIRATSCHGLSMTRRFEKRGFTLIEMMVVIVIVGILASFAYPSYMESVRRARRTDATRALMEAAAAMERYFSQHQSYADATLGTGANDVYRNTSQDGFYTLSFGANPTAAAYSLVATPVAGTTQASDQCGNFMLNNLSVRSVSGTGVTAQECWRMN